MKFVTFSKQHPAGYKDLSVFIFMVPCILTLY